MDYFLYLKAALSHIECNLFFERSHRTVWEMWDLLGGIGMGEKQARNLGEEEVRKKLVERIRKLRQYDEQAIPHLEKAIEALE